MYMARFSKLSILFLVVALLPGPVLRAQLASAPRVTSQVNESELAALKGNVPMMAQSRFDRGEVASSTQLAHIRLVLSRSQEQQAALDKFLAELQDKTSPNYHKWLTPGQFGNLYGPADSDVAATAAWLESHGLKVEGVSSGRTNIAFSGTVSQVEEALHVSIHSFETNGEQFYSNTAEPRIPAALTPVVKGIAHLNTIKPKPHLVRGTPGKYDSSTGRLRPEMTVADRYGDEFIYVVPADAATIYDTPNSVLNANYSASGGNYTGAGVTIGVGGDSAIQTQYVTGFRSIFLGSSYAAAPTVTNVDGVSENSDAAEAYLDNEISGGLAPGAAIHFYISTDLSSGIERALSDDSIDILSLSFGNCEQGMSTSDNAYVASLWSQAAAQGIAVVVSAGDSGSAGCDDFDTQTRATGGLMVSGYASTPYNIAVGGTDYQVLLNNFSQYATSAAASRSAGSQSTYYRTALSYIPESTWNDSTQSDGTLSANVPWSAQDGANIVAGSGGKSNCSTNTSTDTQSGSVAAGSCTSGYSKPYWQRGTGVPADGVRDLPDVSMLAADGGAAAMWLYCGPTAATGDSNPGCIVQNGEFYFDGIGGTSAAAPAFAGILALVQQKTGGRLGQAAVELYDLYNGNHGGSIFHDVTTGNNSVPCTSGSLNCAKNAAGYYFETGYDTTAGYDLATGLGSVDATQLVTYWGTGIGTATAALTVTPSANDLYSGNSLTVGVTVAGVNGYPTPTGTVTLSSGSYSSGAQQLSSGSYQFSVQPNGLPAGTDPLKVVYSGDPTYAGTTDTSQQVNVAQSTFTLSAQNSSMTIAAGATSGDTMTIAVASTTGYTGNVTLTAAVTSSPAGAVAPIVSVSGSPVTLSATQTSGTATVTVNSTAASAMLMRPMRRGAAGWYEAAGSAMFASLLFFFLPGGSRRWRKMLGALLLVAAVSFAGVGCSGGVSGGGGGSSKTTPTVTVTPSKTTISVTDLLTVTVAVSGSSSTPTESVTLSGGGYSSSQTLSAGSASFSIPASTFAAGSVTLTASYSGDSNYNSNTGSSTITVNKASATTSGAYTITVTGTGSDPAATKMTATFNVIVQ